MLETAVWLGGRSPGLDASRLVYKDRSTLDFVGITDFYLLTDLTTGF